ncbi:metallophosphoesterase domain-containing protein 1 [Colletotrichum spaethianum]|uniref:Metallophosphoesterase domain-containing protein 1 n=1 Tax=Colletotrichum spaethianum TaxID=700344 RepID=A0AA37NT89_9PEZI|nr:metallophosphoesterase domain-containing protein 1 [Colletotrichum spaethianum]GKT40582.1 metallophosphoesterase domain-containing protein 1 [Colletotrichum spaethianum]
MATTVETKILIISDTHGLSFSRDATPKERFDVAIHCGDLTDHSKVDEYEETLKLLHKINAPLKLVIAGNHDFSLDSSALHNMIAEANQRYEEPLDSSLVNKEFGGDGKIREMFQKARSSGVRFLDEGTYQFTLQNEGVLKVYASPYIPGTEAWAFQFAGAHDFNIEKGTDIAITHGPPHGIFDISGDKKRIGCPQLFRAVAKSQPKIHCFGHVHGGWGAKLVAWRKQIPETPTHMSAIDNASSVVLENLGRHNEPEDIMRARKERFEQYRSQGYCGTSHGMGDEHPLKAGYTLFVNAAIEDGGTLARPPWLVQVDLETAKLGDLAGTLHENTVHPANTQSAFAPLGSGKSAKRKYGSDSTTEKTYKNLRLE